MGERKNIENLKKKLRDVCDSWGISDEKIIAFVSDGGANIKGAIKQEFGEKKHVTCFGHVINNIGQKILDLDITPLPSEADQRIVELPLEETEIQDDIVDETAEQSSLRQVITKVKRIVTFFRQSERATTELTSVQEVQSNSALKLIQEVKTRWNSCYEMVERFILLADHICKVLLQVITNFH